jgi:hypothetical protein
MPPKPQSSRGKENLPLNDGRRPPEAKTLPVERQMPEHAAGCAGLPRNAYRQVMATSAGRTADDTHAY